MTATAIGREVRRSVAVARKDLMIEWRTRAGFNALLFLAIASLLLFGFALGPDNAALRDAAPGILWLSIFFSGVLAFNRSYQIELENGALEILLLHPGDRRSIFLGKLAANLVFVAVVEIFVVLGATVLFDIAFMPRLPGLIAVMVLGTVGFVTLGTFYAAMASRLRAREVLLPLLLFPMVIPVLLGSVEATTALLAGDPMGRAGAWLRLLAIFDIVYIAACLLGFEYVIEE